MQNKITLIGCPKLDEGDYSEKLTKILTANHIESVTVVRMEVPCCGGIENAVRTALKNCGKRIPWQVVTVSTEGEIIAKLTSAAINKVAALDSLVGVIRESETATEDAREERLKRQ